MKRLLIVLLPLTVAPLIALSVLAWTLSGQVEGQLLAAQHSQHGTLIATFEREFDDEVRRLARRFGIWAGDYHAAQAEAPPDEGQAWTLLFDDQGRWVYPPTLAGSESALVELPEEGLLGGYDQLAEAARHERNPLSVELAAEKYESLADRQSLPPRVRAEAMLGVARCAQKLGRYEQADDAYRRAVEAFTTVVDETGVNFGAEAAAARVILAARDGENDDMHEAWRAYADALTGMKFPMPWALALGHLRNALALAPHSSAVEDAARRAELDQAITRLDTMGRAFAHIPPGEAPEQARFRMVGEQALLYQPATLAEGRGWAVAGFDAAWIREQLVAPQVARLNGRMVGLVALRDGLGRGVLGPTIEPDAHSTELSLSRWGLPWTLEVGFQDLGRLRDQARQRHLLLSGSIVGLVVLIAAGALIGWRMIRREMELSQLKSDFVDNVSHELRTPVTSIKMFSQMLQAGQTDDPERQREYYRLLASESDRLSRMVENMLNFSRIVAGKLALRPRPTDIVEYLTNLQTQLEIQARPTGHHVRLLLADGLPVCSIDGDAVARAIANLVSNAIKFSPDNREITLTAQRRDRMLSLTVRDRGMGIAEEDLPFVFERFYRARNPGGGHVQGTGLGLTIVKDTVARHGGTVRIESRPGEGTVVEMLIPISPGANGR